MERVRRVGSAVRPIRIVSVAGTRPEAIKLAPIALAAAYQPDTEHLLVATGQHEALFDDALAPFGLVADVMMALGLSDATPDSLVDRIKAALPPLLDRLDPDIVVIQGDTTTAWAAAFAAHDHGVPIAHVEAGLRSGDPLLPWPEERNRIEIDRIADLLFAPNARAAANLRAEGVAGGIHITGNSGIDALFALAATIPAAVRSGDRRRLLVTLHRRESFGAPVERVCAALRALARRGDVDILVLRHPNPAGDTIARLLSGTPAIDVRAPQDYRAMIGLIKVADLVLSDSGGLQEECPALGVPLLVLRDNSERPEAIEGGNALLVGTDTAAIVAAAGAILDDPARHAAMARPALPFGDGGAAPRILDAIGRFPFAPR